VSNFKRIVVSVDLDLQQFRPLADSPQNISPKQRNEFFCLKKIIMSHIIVSVILFIVHFCFHFFVKGFSFPKQCNSGDRSSSHRAVLSPSKFFTEHIFTEHIFHRAFTEHILH